MTRGTAELTDPRETQVADLLFREQVRRGRVTPQRTEGGHLPAIEPLGSDERPGVDPAARHRGRRWVRHHGLTVLISLAVALVVGVVTAIGAYTGPIRFDDEGTYVSQALAVLDGRLAPYTYWYDHPPLGWMIIAAWMEGPGAWLGGPNPIAVGRQLMVLIAAATAALVVMVVRRLGGTRAAGAVAGLLFGLSPLAIEFHRMVLLDNLGIFFLMLAWVLALTPSRNLWAAAGAGLTLALAVLCKETLLLIGPFLLWAAWRSYRGPTRKMCIAVFSMAAVFTVLIYPLFAALKGELLPGEGHVSLWDGVMYQLVERTASGSVFDSGSDAHSVVTGWFATDWYLLGAGLAALPLLVRDRHRWPFLGACLLSTLMLLRPGYLPVPYVMVLLPLAAVSLALGADDVARAVARAVRPPTTVVRRYTGIGVALVALAAVAVTVPPAVSSWVDKGRVYAQHDFDAPYRQSVAWLLANTPVDSVIVADNVVWTDLVHVGERDEDSIIWFTKLGTDSDVDSRITDYTQIDYVVVSDIMATSRERAAILDGAIENSEVVRQWGTGAQQITVRRVLQ